MMAYIPVEGTRINARRWTGSPLLVLAFLIAITALAMTTSALDGEVELAHVAYSVLDTDGDGLNDQVEVNAAVHNADDMQTKSFTLEVVLEHDSSRFDLRTADGWLDPNSTVDLVVEVGTDSLSPSGTYTVSVILHANDLTGEVMDSNATSVDLYPKGDYRLTLDADRTSFEVMENTSVDFDLTVVSLSNNPTGVNITVGTTLGWSYQLDTGPLQLDVNDSAVFGLSVEVPPNAPAGAQEVLVVDVVSTRKGTAFASLSLTVTVTNQVFKVELKLFTDRVVVASGNTVTIDGMVTNGGNNLDNITMLADVPLGWTTEFEPPFLLLARGTTKTFVLHLTPPADLKESGTSLMNITALSMGLVHESVAGLTVVYNTAELRLDADGLTFSPSSPASGEEVTLQATVANRGSVFAENVLVVVTSDGRELARTFIDDIPPGGLGVATLRWTVSPGSLLLRVMTDPDDDVPETDEGNNEATLTIHVTSPDLAVVMRDIMMSPDYPTEGTDTTVNVTVTNLAQQPAGPFDVSISVDGDLLGMFTVDTGLAGGANVTLEATWTTVPGRHEVTVEVDPLGQVAEEDNANNEAVRTFTINRRPNAELDVLLTDVEVGETVTLDASGSSDPDGRVRQYHFDYGDGTDSGWVFSTSINHTYGERGTYEVRLYVRDEAGAQNAEPVVITINVEDVDTDDGNGTPALPVPAVIAAMVAMATLATMLARRRDGGGG